MMKKNSMLKLICAVTALAVLTLAAVGALAEGETRVFRMGIDPEYPPFSYLDENGNYAGFDIEMCEAVCKINGWTIQVTPIDWNSRLISLGSDEHDCIWSGMTMTEEMREKEFVLSYAYYDNKQVILTKEGSGIASRDDLAGKRVAVQMGTSGDELLSEEDGQLALAQTFEGGEPIRMESFLVCGTELAADGVDAVVIDLPVAKTLAKDNAGFVILDDNLGSEQYAIAFQKGQDELCAQVEAAYTSLVEDGTYLALAQKYGLDEDQLCLLKK